MPKLEITKKIATFVHYVNHKGGGGKRGTIKTFSRASYRRLKKLVLSLESQPTLFITLTYPEDFPSARLSKKHIDNFGKALKRYFPVAWDIWKLEPQKRGAPHFHLLVGGCSLKTKKDFDSFKNWLSKTWFRIVGSGDEKHLKAGTQVVNLEYLEQQGNNIDYVLIYLSKYFSKIFESVEGWDSPGRFWGIHNRKKLIIEQHLFNVSERFFYKYRRLMRTKIYKYLQRKGVKVKKNQIFQYNYNCIFRDLKAYLWSILSLAHLWDEQVEYYFTVQKGG